MDKKWLAIGGAATAIALVIWWKRKKAAEAALAGVPALIPASSPRAAMFDNVSPVLSPVESTYAPSGPQGPGAPMGASYL